MTEKSGDVENQMLSKRPEQYEDEFIASGEAERVKELIIHKLRSSGWEAHVREDIKALLQQMDESANVREVYERVKDDARRKVPGEIKKELYDCVLAFVTKNNHSM